MLPRKKSMKWVWRMIVKFTLQWVWLVIVKSQLFQIAVKMWQVTDRWQHPDTARTLFSGVGTHDSPVQW
jgi:hypothetical protein